MLVAVGWCSLGLGLASFIIFAVTIWRRPAAGGVPETQVGVEGLAKLAEAVAKVIDALGRAGPSIAALLAAMFFIGLATYIALRAAPVSPENRGEGRSGPVMTRCVLTGFAEGSSRLGAAHAVDGLVQQPPDCIDALVARARQESPVFVALVGRVDRRELQSPARQTYGSNFALAYQRGVTVKNYILVAAGPDALPRERARPSGGETLESRMVVLPGGPAYIEQNDKESSLFADRCVEVLGFWYQGRPETSTGGVPMKN